MDITTARRLYQVQYDRAMAALDQLPEPIRAQLRASLTDAQLVAGTWNTVAALEGATQTLYAALARAIDAAKRQKKMGT